MARICNWIALMAVIVLFAAAEASAEAPNINQKCMAECYFDCNQIKIFTDSECKRDCVLACARLLMRKISEDDENKFFPPWI